MDQQMQTGRTAAWYLTQGASRAATLGRLLEDTINGEVDEETWAAYVDTLAAVADDLATAQATREAIEALVARIDEHMDALQQRRSRAAKVVDAIKRAELEAVVAAGGKVEAGPWVMTAAKGRDVCLVDDEAPLAEWPTELVRTRIEPRRVEALKVLQEGVTLPGARIVQGSPSLRVRPRGGV